MVTSHETHRDASNFIRLHAVGGVLLFLGLAASPARALPPNEWSLYLSPGTESVFVVPEGVHELSVAAIGGSGGDAQDGKGGAGAKVNAPLAVTPGLALYIEVGENGEDLADGGGQVFGGGAAGGGGGGGASDIRTAPYANGLSPDPRLLVAGAGGGAGATGTSELGGDGGDAEMAGGGTEYFGGGAGTQFEGGEGASGCFGNLAGDGGLGSGGEGGDAGEFTGPGGGGGGGYFGGGGGAGACEFASSGGGGGSSLVPPFGTKTLASLAAIPMIEIQWIHPPTIGILTPAEGAVYPQGATVSADYFCESRVTATPPCVGSVAKGASIDTTTLGPHTFTVTSEDSSKGTATKSVTYTVVAKKTETLPSTTLSPPPPVANTVVGSHPKKVIKSKKKKVTVKFSFSSDVAGATFKCKLDKGSFAPCTSPKSYKAKRGSHTFSVEAVSAGGTDPTPATFAFKVKKKQ
jgi:hypothetical protein